MSQNQFLQLYFYFESNIVLQYLKYRIYQDYQIIGIFLFNATVFKGDEVI